MSILRFFFFVFIAMVAALFMGPLFPARPGPSDIAQKVAAASSVESYLQESEGRVVGLKPNAAKGVVWAEHRSSQRTPLSIVYLHGFSATRNELTPVIEKLAQGLGANIYFGRMRAHGLVHGEEFATVKAEDWIEDAREALAIGRRIGEKVVLVGMSFGAMLAMHLALENSQAEDIAAMILISPNFRPARTGIQFISGPLGNLFIRSVIGRERGFKTENEFHENNWTSRYRSEGVVAMMNMCNYIARQDLSRVKVPALVLYTKADKVVDVELLERRFQDLGSEKKTLIDLPEATRHEFANDSFAAQAVGPTVEAMGAFVRSL
jgi:alpha-beta hydrolase superfamily lysophospholipase